MSDTTAPPPDPRSAPLVPCVWADCESYAQLGSNVPLCRWHYGIVVDDYLVHLASIRAEKAPPKQPNGQPSTGWIYYLRVGDLFKIGYAKNLRSRLAAYPPRSTLLAIEPGTRKAEHERHQRFAHRLAEGREWYHEAADLTEWIAEVRRVHGDPSEHAYRPQRKRVP